MKPVSTLSVITRVMKVIICLISTALGSPEATRAAVSTTSEAPYASLELKAMPYYLDTGTIRRSTDLFDPRLVLRNIGMSPDGGMDPLHRVTIEAWDIIYGTTVTYVEVNADVVRSLPKGQMIVEVIGQAKTSGPIVFRVMVQGSGSTRTRDTRTWTVPAFFYNTGCEPLTVTARMVIGGTAYATLSKTVPFKCGE
jgi:hypothetical protein